MIAIVLRSAKASFCYIGQPYPWEMETHPASAPIWFTGWKFEVTSFGLIMDFFILFLRKFSASTALSTKQMGVNKHLTETTAAQLYVNHRQM